MWLFTLLSLILSALLLTFFLYWLKQWLKSEIKGGFFIKTLLACFFFFIIMLGAQFGLFQAYEWYQGHFKNKLTDHPPDIVEPTESKPANTDEISLDYEVLTPSQVKTRFSDIAGMQEAKSEVSEVVDFLNNPKKFERLGATIPKGILLYGPPGTGKTLLARAVAGEAGVSFLAVSGASFDEQWVGVGAARVRKLFDIARKYKPCIIFIDELDALAPKRTIETESNGRVQTINQLLSEMDNINEQRNAGIIVMGATNRLEFLDEAVLRPGRFDRKVYIRLPNLAERQAILKMYLSKTIYSPTIDIQTLAGTTIGFSGADLKNLVNEAAIYAARHNRSKITQQDFEYAKDKITLGLPIASAMVSDLDRKVTAYHEAGHAIVGIFLPHFNLKFDKVTIGVRDETLGVTHFAMTEEHYLDSRKYLEDTISVMLGGRAAEELVFGKMNVTGGAYNDIEKATRLAEKMVLSWGLSNLSSVIDFTVLNAYPSEKTYQAIEDILEKSHQSAQTVLRKHMPQLHALAKALLEKETLSHDEVMKILGK